MRLEVREGDKIMNAHTRSRGSTSWPESVLLMLKQVVLAVALTVFVVFSIVVIARGIQGQLNAMSDYMERYQDARDPTLLEIQ